MIFRDLETDLNFNDFSRAVGTAGSNNWDYFHHSDAVEGSELTVSSKEQRASAPVSCLLMPWRVMAIRWPLAVMMSQSNARWR